jgi:hypothetical protein
MHMITEEIKNIKESKKDLRKFGLTVGIVLLVIAFLLYWKGKDIYPVFGIIGGLLVVASILFPIILRPLNKIWMTLAILMGWIMTRVILIVIFFIVLTPLGLIAKLIGKDFLDLKIDKAKNSYWEVKDKKRGNAIDYERQF